MLISNFNFMAEQKMAAVARAVGAIDVAYMVDFRAPEKWFGRNWMRSIQNRDGIVYSSGMVEEYAAKSKTLIAQKDLNLHHVVANGLHVWEYQKLKGLTQKQRSLMNDNGYSHKVTYTVPISGNNDYVGRFFFLFKDLDNVTNGELLREMCDAIPRESSVIDSFQSLMLLSQYIVSPFVGYGLIKPSSVKILTMAAEGFNRNEIANECHLSSRGVDYHIERMKILLNAKNNSNLIYMATKNFII